MSKENIAIVGFARTPIGALNGIFKNESAPTLGAHAIQAAIRQGKIDTEQIDSSIMGCVLSAGLGQAPARQASLKAGLPTQTEALTINKMCGSGLKAVMLAHDLILAGSSRIVVAGGMESMTQAPYLIPKARNGYRLGHAQLLDSMMLDGLEDAYQANCPMGYFAEQTAAKLQFSRQVQDEFAILSLQRAQAAQKNGSFDAEIHPVNVKDIKGNESCWTADEQPQLAKIDKIPLLKPVFVKDGTVTAANSSSISDGAAALVLMKEEQARAQNVLPLAMIRAHATHAQEPAWFTTAPVTAIRKVLAKANWDIQDVDLFEINEAFAVVTLATIQELKLDINKVNIFGGACALGHPIGASGARILVTLINALRRSNKSRGVASLCIGGGEAVAIAVEII